MPKANKGCQVYMSGDAVDGRDSRIDNSVNRLIKSTKPLTASAQKYSSPFGRPVCREIQRERIFETKKCVMKFVLEKTSCEKNVG